MALNPGFARPQDGGRNEKRKKGLAIREASVTRYYALGCAIPGALEAER